MPLPTLSTSAGGSSCKPKSKTNLQNGNSPWAPAPLRLLAEALVPQLPEAAQVALSAEPPAAVQALEAELYGRVDILLPLAAEPVVAELSALALEVAAEQNPTRPGSA